MKTPFARLVLFSILLLVIAPAAFGQPAVTTDPATLITGSSARLNGTVTSPGSPADTHFDWGLTPSYGNSTPIVTVSAASTPVPILSTISGLDPNTLYHFRATASTDLSGTGNGLDVTFTTAPVLPGVTTLPADNIGSSSATLVASVNPNNSPTDVTFEWGLTVSYGDTSIPSVHLSAGMSEVPATFDVSALSPSTTYHFRAKAYNAAGRATGADQMFTTTAAGLAPSVATELPDNVGPYTARLKASVNPNGLATTLHFQYGLTTSYGSSTPDIAAGSGSSAVELNFAVKGLTPNGKYHVRAVAASLGGTVLGGDQSFTTTAAGPSPVPAMSVWGLMMLGCAILLSVILLRRFRRNLM